MKSATTVERRSDREVTATRFFNAPARLVFEAWSRPELFKQWWIPQSFGMTLWSCEMDVRVGGGYRLEIGHGDAKPMAFFGKYLEVTPPSRLVWSNEESPDGAITTVTFEEQDGRTKVVVSEVYPTKEALDANIGAMEGGVPESLDQLEVFLAGQATQRAR